MLVLQKISILLVCLFLSACGIAPGFERPQVDITSFALAPQSSGAMTPRFNIGIRVINPNRISLPLQGMSYSIEIEGNRILSGAKPDLPQVPAYGMADFTIEASPDLIGSARLLNDLFTRQRASLGFTFRARLDLGGLLPFVNVEESGSFGLPGLGR
jgi:hypothetical protein